MKRFWRCLGKAAKLILFIAGLMAILLLSMCVLIFKQEDGTLPMRDYYDLPEDTVDVLFLGSSHVGMNISTKRLWEEDGIAGYKCWGSIQPIWNTYYYLKECLEYQTPKVVVVDVHGALLSNEYGDYARQVKNTLGMRFSRNKVEAVMASAPKDMWSTLLLGLPTYHSRYNELTKEDFAYFPWNRHPEIPTLANETMERVFGFDILPPDATQGIEPLEEKEEKYFRMIIELCRDRGIPLELVAAPYQISEFEQKRLRAVAALAEEYEGLRFTDFNLIYDRYGIDPWQDYVDPGHFNRSGVAKYTDGIGTLLLEHYELPDRRQDPKHIWNHVGLLHSAPVFSLDRQFKGDGRQDYVDTGCKLYENPLASWTLLTEFELPPIEDTDKVIISCYSEEKNQYRGLLVKVDENGCLAVCFSSSEAVYSDHLRPNECLQLAVVKNVDTVHVWLNGEQLGTVRPENAGAFSGNLLIGCQETAAGEHFRYSRPKVLDLQVYEQVLSENQIRVWKRAELPEMARPQVLDLAGAHGELVYALPNRFEGDGLEERVDTGLRLYEDPEASWTLLARIDPEIGAGDNVYFACFREEAGNYAGLLLRRPDPEKLNLVYGPGFGTEFPLPKGEPSRLAIVKDRSAYTVYLNGETVLEGASAPCGAYDGPLLVGCELDGEGSPFRISGTTVYDLEVYGGILSPETIAAWDPEPRPSAEKPVGQSVEFRLETGFAGNGRSAALDTGIRLYDVPDKNWSLHAVIDCAPGTTGTAFSCFAEDPSDYRGLTLRRVDESSYGLTLGSTYVTVSCSPSPTLILDIVKQGYDYSVYVDGELREQVQGRCRSWDGTLLLCAERSGEGALFRFSDQRVRELQITDELLGEKEIAALYRADKQANYYQKG